MFQNGLTRFFLVIVVCVCVHLQISLCLCWLGFVNAGVAPPGTRVTPRIGALAALRGVTRAPGVLVFVFVCVCGLLMYLMLAFECRLIMCLFRLKWTC